MDDTDKLSIGSKRWWDSIEEGGVWEHPRGLMFRTEGQTLVLFERLPWTDGMPLNEQQLNEQQDTDLHLLKMHFAAIGVKLISRI